MANHVMKSSKGNRVFPGIRNHLIRQLLAFYLAFHLLFFSGIAFGIGVEVRQRTLGLDGRD